MFGTEYADQVNEYFALVRIEVAHTAREFPKEVLDTPFSAYFAQNRHLINSKDILPHQRSHATTIKGILALTGAGKFNFDEKITLADVVAMLENPGLVVNTL